MKKLSLLIILMVLTTIQTGCMNLKAMQMEFTTPSRVHCILDGIVIYNGTPSGVMADGYFTYIQDEKTGQMLKTEAKCTYYY